MIPGRYTDENHGDVFLHQSSGGKDRLKTNLEKHIVYVQESGVIDAIRLLKLWKVKNGLQVKNFILELLVIELLNKKRKMDLANQLAHVWKELRDNVDTVGIEDPANPTGNNLSELFVKAKPQLQNAARLTLGIIEQSGWEALFGPVETVQKESFRLADYSHREPSRWEERRICRAHVDAQVWSAEKEKKLGGLNSDGRVLPSGLSLRYEVRINTPPPYKVYWQVVNTGEHARRSGGLRGQIFAGDSRHPSVQWESTLYTGKHWIECFIVKDNICVAKSKFFVNIRGKQSFVPVQVANLRKYGSWDM